MKLKHINADRILLRSALEQGLGMAAHIIAEQAEKIQRLERLKARGESVNDYLHQGTIMMKSLLELRDNTDFSNAELVKNSINKICARLAFGVDELKRINEEKEI